MCEVKTQACVVDMIVLILVDWQVNVFIEVEAPAIMFTHVEYLLVIRLFDRLPAHHPSTTIVHVVIDWPSFWTQNAFIDIIIKVWTVLFSSYISAGLDIHLAWS